MQASEHDAIHHHGHVPAHFNAAFAVGIGLNLLIVAAQVVFGILAGSLALLSDAAHNFSDVIGLVVAWGAGFLGRMSPTQRHTYGYRKASVLAALVNAALLFLTTLVIIAEAVHRLVKPEPVAGATVMWVAALGIGVNAVVAFLFMRGRENDLNIRGAFLHMAADAVVSFGVLVAGALILWTHWSWLDPLVSLVIAAVVLWGTWGLARDATNLALDGVPAGVDRNAVTDYLAALPGVTEVHDLHIWGMSTSEVALTAHLVRPLMPVDDGFLKTASHVLAQHYRITHVTLQVEAGDPAHPCPFAPTDVV